MIQHQKLALCECPNRFGFVPGPVDDTGFFNKNGP